MLSFAVRSKWIYRCCYELFFCSSRRRHTRYIGDWSSDVCSSDLAAGIVVSNHGGRQLDRAVTTVQALPEVVDAVAGRAPVLVDGGIRDGLDVLTALALGADAVLLGRPVVWALAAGGQRGVEDLLEWLVDDLAHAMTLAGAPDLASVTPDLVAGH